MGCCDQSNSTNLKTGTSDLLVQFLFLDENVCQPCSGTADALDEAVQITAASLAAMGVDLKVEKSHVIGKEEAIAQKLLTSPTIRINGTDIDPNLTEGECGTCGDLAGGTTTVNCRTWEWRGEVYQNAPIGKIVEAIMDAAVSANKTQSSCCSGETVEDDYVIPENLEAFFVARQNNEKSCC